MDLITYAMSKKYTDSKINVGMFCGTVPPGGAFPTTRLDGSPLQNEDFVKPLATATFPYTVGTVTFVNKFTQGLYLSGTWVANPGIIQDTSETPVKSPSTESLGGTAATQMAINIENKTAINNRVEKFTSAYWAAYAHNGATQTEVKINGSPVAGSIPKYSAGAQLRASNPVSDLDCVNKQYLEAKTVLNSGHTGHEGDLLAISAAGDVAYKDPSDLQPVWGNITGSLSAQLDLSSSLGTKVNITDIINNVTSTDIDKPLSAKMGKELQDQITTLSSMGRFLSTWNCRTGLPGTNPTVMPYAYKTGDYYIVNTVAAAGGTNFKPFGNQYDGTASTTAEAGEIHENDFYQYDGTTWMKLSHSGQTVLFSQIAGDPYDNTNLAAALNAKYTKPTTGIPKTDLATDVFALYRMASEQDIIDADKVDKVAGKGLSTDDFDEDLYYNKVTVDEKIATITATFRGSFATKAALLAYPGPMSNNDYAYVEADESHFNQKWRYTYDGAAWQAEFRVDGNGVWGTISGNINDQADIIAKYYDKPTIDDKLASNTATFRGAFANKAALVAYAGQKVKNDYAVVLEDETHSGECWRYKFDASAWISEYRVNETPFTPGEWAAIDSGISATKVAAYDAHKNATNNPHGVTKAQIGLGDVNNTADADKPISTAQQAALDLKLDAPTSAGTAGQIMKKTATGTEWSNQYPTTGATGQVLTKTATGVEWDDAASAWEGTKAQYDAMASHDPEILYCITDDSTPVDVYTKAETDALLAPKQETANLVSAWQATPDDTHYPSEKLVKDNIDAMLQTFYDAVHPLNELVIGFAAPTVPAGVTATWTVDTTYDGKALWVDSTQTAGTALTGALPTLPTVTANTNGSHSHSYTNYSAINGLVGHASGTSIDFWGAAESYKYSSSAKLYYNGQLITINDGGSHSHSCSYGSSTVYGQASGTTVRPTSVVVHVYKRTA